MEQVGVASFQRYSETLTGRAAVSAELILEEHSPEVVVALVVALEGQSVTCLSEL